MIRFKDLIKEQGRDDWSLEELLSNFARRGGDEELIQDIIKRATVECPKELQKAMHIPVTCYRGTYLPLNMMTELLPDWDKKFSLYLTKETISFSKSISQAREFMYPYGLNAPRFDSMSMCAVLLKYTTQPSDFFIDFNKLKVYHNLEDNHKEVVCRPSGKVEIIQRELPWMEYVNNLKFQDNLMFAKKDIPKNYWKKISLAMKRNFDGIKTIAVKY